MDGRGEQQDGDWIKKVGWQVFLLFWSLLRRLRIGPACLIRELVHDTLIMHP